MTSRSRLRELTRPEHALVDRLFSRFDLSQAAAYRSFLFALGSAHLAVEGVLDAGGATSILEDWPERRRADLLRADLADLGIEAPASADPPSLRSEAELLGGVYVLEGSRQGAALLSSRLAAGAPARFLTARARPGSWGNLLALLDARLDSLAKLDAAVAAAQACFGCFERAARMELEPLVA